MTRSDYNAMNEIREARQKAGITQKRAAEICGVPLRFIFVAKIILMKLQSNG